jgi:hypothetical protein
MMIRDMDIAAELMGVRPLTAKLSAFAVSSYICGVAGAMMVFFYLGRGRAFGVSITLSFQILFMVIWAGLAAWSAPSWARPSSGSCRSCCARAAGHRHRYRCGETVEHINFMIVGRIDHLLPDRRAARAGPAVADRKGETENLAVPVRLTADTRIAEEAVRDLRACPGRIGRTRNSGAPELPVSTQGGNNEETSRLPGTFHGRYTGGRNAAGLRRG